MAFSTIRGAFEYQGQKCSATSRMYVPKSMWEGQGLKDLMVNVTNSLKMGQSDDFKSFMSAVIDRTAFDKHVRYLDAIKASNDVEILVGGGHDDSVGYFIEPTIAVVSDPYFQTMNP